MLFIAVWHGTVLCQCDRPHVLRTFAQWAPHSAVQTLPQAMVLPLYRRALFVPCGNDNSGLGMDVSRIQEVRWEEERREESALGQRLHTTTRVVMDFGTLLTNHQ